MEVIVYKTSDKERIKVCRTNELSIIKQGFEKGLVQWYIVGKIHY